MRDIRAASGEADARATYGLRLRILHWHADVVLSSSFLVSLRIFEQKRDCSQSTSHRKRTQNVRFVRAEIDMSRDEGKYGSGVSSVL